MPSCSLESDSTPTFHGGSVPTVWCPLPYYSFGAAAWCRYRELLWDTVEIWLKIILYAFDTNEDRHTFDFIYKFYTQISDDLKNGQENWKFKKIHNVYSPKRLNYTTSSNN